MSAGGPEVRVGFAERTRIEGVAVKAEGGEEHFPSARFEDNPGRFITWEGEYGHASGGRVWV